MATAVEYLLHVIVTELRMIDDVVNAFSKCTEIYQWYIEIVECYSASVVQYL